MAVVCELEEMFVVAVVVQFATKVPVDFAVGVLIAVVDVLV